jgi:hypothetical protein
VVDHVSGESIGVIAPVSPDKVLVRRSLCWWRDPPALLRSFGSVSRSKCDWYRIGDVSLGIDSDDFALRRRFSKLYGECLLDNRADTGAWVHCRVQTAKGSRTHLVTFTGPGKIELMDLILQLFHDRGYVEFNEGTAGWRALSLAGRDYPLLIANGDCALVDSTQPWQPLIANCALNLAMSALPDLLFFHAAAVVIGGAGVLLVGSKGAGKTTLSMALASRGHAFIGDEIVAVRVTTNELVPVRKAVSIRPGPRSRRVKQLLRHCSHTREEFPDGSTRMRAKALALFPAVVDRSFPLRCMFFLRQFEENPRIEKLLVGAADLQLLTPLAWRTPGASAAKRFMQVAKLVSNVKCYSLYPGLPDEAAALVERIARV